MTRNKSAMRRIVIATAILFVVVAFAIDRLRHRAPATGKSVQVTRDGGLATDPAVSRNGRWLVYASDRGSRGTLNLWIRPVAGGEARRLTNGDVDDHEPAFSPDGATVAYRSERDGGGIYTIAAAGGAPRLLASQGREPRWSPDGRWIAYWARTASGRSQAWTVAAAGGTPRAVAASLPDVRRPLWSPDGKHLLVAGTDNDRFDWWTVPADGAAVPTRTGALSVLQVQSFRTSLAPGEWSGSRVYFAGRPAMGPGRDNTGIWRMEISTELQFAPTAHSVTPENVDAEQPAAGPDESVFYVRAARASGLWSLPLSNQGELIRVAAADARRPMLVASANHLLYRATEGFHTRELASGADTRVPGEDLVSPGGRKVECRNCGEPFTWSEDESKLLFRSHRRGLGLLYAATGERREILRGFGQGLYITDASFSPDARWIAVRASEPGGSPRLYVVPFGEGTAPARKDWIELDPPEMRDRSPRWSPDGKLLYFLSERDGFRCLWARRLHPATRRPEGEAFAVRHLHGACLSATASAETGLAVTRSGLFLILNETTGEVWRTR